MQMQLSSNARIPDGLLAEMTLLNEKPRLGLRTSESTPYPGFTATQSTTALGHSWSVASGTRWASLSCEFGACGGGPTSFQSAAAAAPIPAAVCAVAEPCGVAAVAVTGVVAGGIIAYENKDAIKGSWTALADSFLKNYNNLQNENNNRCAVVKQAAIASCSAQFVGRGLSESPVLTRACVRIQMTAQGCFNY